MFTPHQIFFCCQILGELSLFRKYVFFQVRFVKNSSISWRTRFISVFASIMARCASGDFCRKSSWREKPDWAAKSLASIWKNFLVKNKKENGSGLGKNSPQKKVFRLKIYTGYWTEIFGANFVTGKQNWYSRQETGSDTDFLTRTGSLFQL